MGMGAMELIKNSAPRHCHQRENDEMNCDEKYFFTNVGKHHGADFADEILWKNYVKKTRKMRSNSEEKVEKGEKQLGRTNERWVELSRLVRPWGRSG